MTICAYYTLAKHRSVFISFAVFSLIYVRTGTETRIFPLSLIVACISSADTGSGKTNAYSCLSFPVGCSSCNRLSRHVHNQPCPDHSYEKRRLHLCNYCHSVFAGCANLHRRQGTAIVHSSSIDCANMQWLLISLLHTNRGCLVHSFQVVWPNSFLQGCRGYRLHY